MRILILCDVTLSANLCAPEFFSGLIRLPCGQSVVFYAIRSGDGIDSNDAHRFEHRRLADRGLSPDRDALTARRSLERITPHLDGPSGRQHTNDISVVYRELYLLSLATLFKIMLFVKFVSSRRLFLFGKRSDGFVFSLVVSRRAENRAATRFSRLLKHSPSAAFLSFKR
jgi:hypothetical protein